MVKGVKQVWALQLGFERFQYISLNEIQFAKIKVSHSMCGPG